MLKKLTTVVLLVSLAIPTMTVYGQTTEDDGYTYPDDASEDEKQHIDDTEQQLWEDAGRPGDNDNNNDDDNECENPPTAASCNNGEDTHGVQTDDDDGNVYNCNDKSCLGPGNTGPGSCYSRGVDDGKNGDFNRDLFLDECGPFNTHNRYYIGFIDGCMDVKGNTKDVCESATDANNPSSSNEDSRAESQDVPSNSAAVPLSPSPNTSLSPRPINDPCYTDGFNDGMHSGFNNIRYMNCKGHGEYGRGFSEGCKSIENPADVCVYATGLTYPFQKVR
jgi:hypothetical protein